jgi:hypothetical protein
MKKESNMNDKHKYHTDDHCCHDECLSGKRNHYFKGKNMTADDFTLEQRYGIERRHLLNRVIHGWGVAYGFELGVKDGKLTCGPGLALDEHGRELFRAESGVIPAHQIKLFMPLTKTESNTTGIEAETAGIKCLLSAHYAERRIDELRTGDSCGCSEREWNHICETIVFSLKPLPNDGNCPDSELSCQACACHEGDKPRVMEAIEKGRETHADLDRGPHRCLCHWLTEKAETIPGDSGELCIWEGFKEERIAVNDPVPLACVTITIDHCGHPVFEKVNDPCTPRKLIKTNDLLFDLIRGCDLTQIDEISWSAWHRKLTRDDMMPWEVFEQMIFPKVTRTTEKTPETRVPIKTDFWIHFSRPVVVATLRVDCVTMTVHAPEDEGGWIEVRRVPITGLATSTSGDFADKVNLCVDSGWCDDEVLGHKSIFHRPKVRVEIEVRGDLILDCHGQAVDANAVGLRPMPTGNGTPGGTFISSFRVAPKRETEHAKSSVD